MGVRGRVGCSGEGWGAAGRGWVGLGLGRWDWGGERAGGRGAGVWEFDKGEDRDEGRAGRRPGTEGWQGDGCGSFSVSLRKRERK